MEKVNVLLIDDDELFLFLTEKSLGKARCIESLKSFDELTDAQEFLDSCMAENCPFPDVIFVDLNMPGMNGMEFAQIYSEKYFEKYPDTKLVILTSSISRKEKVEAMEVEAVKDFMQKPLTEEKLKSLFEASRIHE